jgi:M6 family metalloprotease-like protein
MPGFTVCKQADGTSLIISKAGSDERIKLARTVDWYTILDNGKGVYVYAVKDVKGNLVASKMKAHDPARRSAGEKAFVAKLEKGLAFTSAQIEAKRPAPMKKHRGAGTQVLLSKEAFPTTGTNLKHLVICVDFPDKPWTRDMQNVRDMYNQTGYQSPTQGQTGCFNDLWKTDSFNQLSIVTTVVGPYRMAQNHDYYGNDAGSPSGYDANKQVMVLEAIAAAQAAGVNFKDYDNDSNGYCDPFGIMTAGYGVQGGASADWFTTCMDSPVCYGGNVYTKNGVKICGMYCVPEFRDGSGSVPDALGGPVHEFGHCMWLWDSYYGTYNMACWDLMSGGSWGGGWGDKPISNCAYGKILCGWITPTTISTTQTGITLQNAQQNSVAYKIATANPQQYILVENRQQVGFDEFLANHGLLVMHENDADPQNAVRLVAADNDYTCNFTNYAGDIYPGTSNVTSVTETTAPSLKTFVGEYFGNAITNIADVSGVVTLDYTKATPAAATAYSCNSVVLDKGTLSSGDHSSTHVSDDAYMQVTSAKSGQKYNAQETYTFDTGVTSNLTYLDVTVEASLNTGSKTQTVLIYNPATSTWVSLGNNTVTTTDSTVKYYLQLPNTYKTAAGQIKLRVQVLDSATTFIHKTDLVQINALP